MDLGFGVVISTQGRGTVPEDDPCSLGAFNSHKPAEASYQTCDAVVIVGSRPRGNETLRYELELSRPLYRIDVDVSVEGHYYASDYFVCGDSAFALDDLTDRSERKMQIDAAFTADLRTTHEAAVDGLVDSLGPYAKLVETL